MEIIKMEQVEGKVNQRGVLARQLIRHKDTTVMNLVLRPGDTVPPHAVPVNVFFYVVEGKGTIRIGDEEEVVVEKDIILCPPETEMSLRADQGQSLTVLNVKTPSLQ